MSAATSLRPSTSALRDEVAEMIASLDFDDMTAAHLAPLYESLYHRTYGTHPRDASRERALGLPRQHFGGDARAAAKYLVWIFRRAGAERARGFERAPYGFGLVFSAACVTDYLSSRPARDDSDEREAPSDERPRAPAGDDEPIIVGTDEKVIADAVIAKLAAAPNLYVRGGRLVRVLHDAQGKDVLLRSAGAPRIVHVSPASLRELIAEHASFARHDKAVHVPDWCVRAIHDRGEYPALRRLVAVVDHPVLRADGSVFVGPGYDASTEILVHHRAAYAIGEATPTREDAQRARDELLEIFCDFPFEREEHLATCIAALLTPFARSAFAGPVPLFAIDKNVRGAGGTLLADAIGVVATGRPMPRTVAAKSAEEERKRITAIALAGDAIVLIDNVAGTLGTDALDNALTATTWKDRILGKTEMTAELPLATTWFATGNNIEFGADTLRRVAQVRLESPEERPEERSGFRHPDLLAWCRAERPRLVAAALTVLRAFCIAGRPDARLTPWGSYEAWSALVRGAVVWSGLRDPGKTREELTSTGDAEKNALYDLLREWRTTFGAKGATVAEALRALGETTGGFAGRPKHAALRAALSELCPPPRADALPAARAVAARLKKLRGRVVGGLAFDVRAKGASGVPLIVREVRASDSSDSSDSVLTPSREEEDPRPKETESLESPESLPRKLRKRSELRPKLRVVREAKP